VDEGKMKGVTNYFSLGSCP